MKRRSRFQKPPAPPKFDSNAGVGSSFNYATIAILGGVFILGITLGIAFSSTANFSPENVATRVEIDASAPNPELCAQFGASAIAADTRFFITLNPFNVYVSQPKMQPGCVLRSNNWAVLDQRNVVTSKDRDLCRRRMNTFAFTGDLGGENPDVRCVYQNNSAGNLFLKRGAGELPPETNRF
ncbi:MAG: DUF3172 domain-containing protein [Cyanothece sp. SIO1E1]|nr:DUF3172 domain-containing protein [Cyanothece sp. SIO1E1]